MSKRLRFGCYFAALMTVIVFGSVPALIAFFAHAWWWMAGFGVADFAVAWWLVSRFDREVS